MADIIEQNVPEILVNNYLPYAVYTIVDRAIPAIDGLKPVHRKILYTMYKMGLQNNKTRCANIVGQTMKLHPHGDMSIYEALVKLSTGNETLLEPYIESKGSFGKAYSRDIKFAASRYTEAGLAPITKELFESIDEDAVDFIDNYDGTMKLPFVLPVKFPNILVNNTSGIAVGMASTIPTFNLKDVCNATIGIIKGEIKDTEQLFEVLGPPDFPGAGVIHKDDKVMKVLLETGKASVTVSGKYRIEKNKVYVTEIPFRSTVEDIVDRIIEGVKDKSLSEVVNVIDTTDIKGLGLLIELRKEFAKDTEGVQRVMDKILYKTGLRSKLSYNTNVIINNTPENISVMALLKEWIAFRETTVNRIYNFRLKKKTAQQASLIVWEMLKDNIAEVQEIIVKNRENDAKSAMQQRFGLSEEQVDTVLDTRSGDFTTDKVNKKLKSLADNRKECIAIKKVIDSKSERYNIIVKELEDIAKKYGHKRRSEIGGSVETKYDREQEIKAALKFPVKVIVAENGFVAKFNSDTLLNKFIDKNVNFAENSKTFSISNDSKILVIYRDGMVYRVDVADIELNPTGAKQTIKSLTGYNEDILYIDRLDDYNRYVILFNKTQCSMFVVPYNKFNGVRRMYKNVFEPFDADDKVECIETNKFFIISSLKRAVFKEVSDAACAQLDRVYRIPLPRLDVTKKERYFGTQPLSKVPASVNLTDKDVEYYRKSYFVKIKGKLW